MMMMMTTTVQHRSLLALACLLLLSLVGSASGFLGLSPASTITGGKTNTPVSVSSSKFLLSEHRRVVQSAAFRLKAGPAVLEPPTKEKTEEKVEKKQDDKESASNYKKGGWAVRLFNDPFNKREFVSMVLCKICGLTDGQSYQVMMQAHQNGVAVVGRYDLERAELFKTALVENGLVSDMIPVDED